MRWQDFDHHKWLGEDAAFDHEAFDTHWAEVNENCNTMEELLEATKKSTAGRPPWKPGAYHNKDGNQIEIVLSEDPSYTKWLNPQIAVVLSCETDEVVGVTVCGAKKLFEEKP